MHNLSWLFGAIAEHCLSRGGEILRRTGIATIRQITGDSNSELITEMPAMCLQRTNNEKREDVRQIISLFNSVLCYFKNLRGAIKAMFIVKKQYLLATPLPSSTPCCQPAGKALLGKGVQPSSSSVATRLDLTSTVRASSRGVQWKEQGHLFLSSGHLAHYIPALPRSTDKWLRRSERHPDLEIRNVGVQLFLSTGRGQYKCSENPAVCLYQSLLRMWFSIIMSFKGTFC